MSLTVSIADGKCCGYGICAEICPSVYQLDEQGFAFVSDGAVSPEDEEAAVEGAEACPENAILLHR